MKLLRFFLAATLCGVLCGSVYAIKNNNVKSVLNCQQNESLYELIKKQINEIKETGKWSKDLKKSYLEIKNDIIPLLENRIEKDNAIKLLDNVYCEILVKDAQYILDSGCKRSGDHTLLKTLIKEINASNNTVTLNEENLSGIEYVLALNQTHKDVSSFLWVSNQKNVSYKTAYDTEYETNKINKVDSFIENKDVKCSRHHRELNRMKNDTTYFVNRRMSYCRDVVYDYLQCTIPSQNELDYALYNIDIVEYVSRDSILKWDSIMDLHYKSLQPISDTLINADTLINMPIQIDTLIKQ